VVWLAKLILQVLAKRPESKRSEPKKSEPNKLKSSENDQQTLIVATAESTPAENVGNIEMPITLENANAMTLAGEQFIAASPEALVARSRKP